jgi:hypothetical protein
MSCILPRREDVYAETMDKIAKRTSGRSVKELYIVKEGRKKRLESHRTEQRAGRIYVYVSAVAAGRP